MGLNEDSFLKTISLYKQGMSQNEISQAVGRPRRTIRRWIATYKETLPTEAIVAEPKPSASTKEPLGDKFILTSYVYGSSINTKALASMQAFAKAGYAVMVMPISLSGTAKMEHTSSRLPQLPDGVEWLINREIKNDLFTILNLVGVRQTYGHLKSVSDNYIVPSHYFEVVSTPSVFLDAVKYVITTGTCSDTHALYAHSQVGFQQKKRHRCGFLKIEKGVVEQHTFEDYDKKVDAFILGDVHLPYVSQDFFLNFIERLEEDKPSTVILHDYFDLAPISHHTYSSVEATLNRECLAKHFRNIKAQHSMLMSICMNHNVKPIIVSSNHDVHFIKGLLDRPLDKLHSKDEFELYFKLGTEFFVNGKKPVEAVLASLNVEASAIDIIDANNRFNVNGYNLQYHGDSGVNGSKWASSGISKLGVKAVVGHSHSASRIDDVLTVGTSSRLDLGYNAKGLSSWSDCNVLVRGNNAHHVIKLT